MNPGSSFPQELIDLVIDNVASFDDSNPKFGRTAALSACAQTSTAFYPSASRYLFSIITLSTDRASWKRQTLLYETFRSRPGLLEHVRSLSVVVVPEFVPLQVVPNHLPLNCTSENAADKSSYRNGFLFLLQLMAEARLESLCIKGEPNRFSNWESFDDEARASLFILRNHPSLKSLHLTSMISVERAFIIGSPDYNTLQNLFLGPGLSHIEKREHAPPSATHTFHFLFNLKRLTSIEDLPRTLFPWDGPRTPKFQLPLTPASSSINNLTHLSVSITSRNVQFLWSLLKHATRSLKCLEMRQLTKSDPIFPGLIHLERLRILRELKLRGTEISHEPHAFGHLIPMIEVLLSPNSPISVEHLTLFSRCFITYRSLEEAWINFFHRQSKDWLTLDSILTGENFPSLRIVDLSICLRHFPFSQEDNYRFVMWADMVRYDLRKALPTVNSPNSMITLNVSFFEVG